MNTPMLLWTFITFHRLRLACCVCAFAFSSSAVALKFPTTHLVSDIAVGDINGDSLDDIITCGSNDARGSVNVLINIGDGTFRGPEPSAAGPGPGKLALGDFDLDGHLDVVTANFGIGGDF